MTAVRVVIVNYNSDSWLARCVAAMTAQSLSDFEVVIIDNASEDGSAGLALPDGRFTLQHARKNLGFAAGCNAGARGATTPWLVMLNPDAIPEPDWLSRMLEASKAYPTATMLGSTQVMADKTDHLDGCGDRLSFLGFPWRGGYDQPVPDLQDGEVFSPCAAAAFYRRDAFEAAGGFEESFFCYIEDVDLAFRLRLRGDSCMQIASARVAHGGSVSTGRISAFTLFHSYRNRIWMLYRSLPFALLAVIMPLHLAACLYLILRTLRQQPVLPRLHGLWAGLSGLPSQSSGRQLIQNGRRISASDICRLLCWSLDQFRHRLPDPRVIKDSQ